MRSGWKRRDSFSAMHFGPRARLGDTWWSVISTPVVALARLGRDDSNDESRSLINEVIYRTCNTSISRCPQCGREQATGGRSDWPISDSWECCWTDRSYVRRRGSRSTRTQARLIVDSVRFVDARRFNSPRSVHVEPFKPSSRRPTDATAGRFATPTVRAVGTIRTPRAEEGGPPGVRHNRYHCRWTWKPGSNEVAYNTQLYFTTKW